MRGERRLEYWMLNRGRYGHLPWWKEGMPWQGYGVVTDMAGHRHAVHVLPSKGDVFWVVAKYNTKETMLKAYWEVRDGI